MIASLNTPIFFFGLLLVVIAVALLLMFLVNPKDFPRKEFLGAVWPLTKAHLWFLIGVLIFQQLFVQIPTVLTAVVQAAMNLSNEEPISSGLNYVVSFVLSSIVQSGFIALALHLIDGVPARFSDLFSQFSIFWRYVGASILYGLLVGFGFILLIVPGIFWMLTYCLWPYFLIDKKVSVLDSLKMSAQTTRGHKRSLLALFVFVVAMNILGLSVFIIGLFVTVPMTTLIFAFVYRTLTRSPSATPSGSVVARAV